MCSRDKVRGVIGRAAVDILFPGQRLKRVLVQTAQPKPEQARLRASKITITIKVVDYFNRQKNPLTLL